MTKRRHPLDDTFDFAPPKKEDDLLKDDLFDIEIPENPSLDDIASIALQAYKSHMMDIHYMEPKYRARNLEVAELYLNLAKDALAKKAEIKIKDGKLELDKSKHGKKPEEGDGKIGTRGGILSELEEKMKAHKK